MAELSYPPNYPLGEHMAERLRARSERPLAEVTVDACAAGTLAPADIAVHADTLRLQADVARRAGRPQLAENLERAAEMVAMPAELIFEVYEKLRPGRARDAAELTALAERLRRDYGAARVGHLIEGAARAYAERNLFIRRFGGAADQPSPPPEGMP